MKKFAIFAFAALLVVAFTVPAYAVESIVGGYWRTRIYTQTDFSGLDDEAQDLTQADSRTRLYYTLKFSDDLKFVNKWELDYAWGVGDMGDIGADGTGVIEYKNTYVDFNVGAWNAKVGTHSATWGRAFLFADDFSGITATYKGDGFSLPLIWIKEYEGGMGLDANDYDVDMYGLNPSFTAGSMNINPFLLYLNSEDYDVYGQSQEDPPLPPTGIPVEVTAYWLGLNLDMKFDSTSLWATAIILSGEVDETGSPSYDLSGFLAAVGASTDLGGTGLHGQVFYASGDDDPLDPDEEAWVGPTGDSYYWAEIMGLGAIDNQASAGSPSDSLTNIMAANIGVTFPMDKLTLAADLWYAALIEDDANGNTDLGIEIDLKASYMVVENLKLDVIVAYLSAGDSTTTGIPNTEDPMEIGAVLSLSF